MATPLEKMTQDILSQDLSEEQKVLAALQVGMQCMAEALMDGVPRIFDVYLNQPMKEESLIELVPADALPKQGG